MTEKCDDGNTAAGDGCSAQCTKEDGYTCETPNCTLSSCKTVCGDGYRAGDEECDDGDLESNDGCSSECTVEADCGYTCDGGNATTADVCTSSCGDGFQAHDEACDDGNSVNDDGCTGCSVDAGWTCSGVSCQTSVCTPPTTSSTPTPTTTTSTPPPTSSSSTTVMPTTTPHVIAPEFVHGSICQSSAWPCAENNITVCFSTNSKLNSDLGLALQVSGLLGFNAQSEKVAVQGPPSGDMKIHVLNSSGVVFNESGSWNRTRGDLRIGLANDTQPYQINCFRFTVVNPTQPQECAMVKLSMLGLVLDPLALYTTNSRFCSRDLVRQGECQAGPFPRSPATLLGGGCPLKVVAPVMLLKNIGQSTAKPCSINTITVSLAFNVPMMCSTCLSSGGPRLSISGLNGTSTLSTGEMPVQLVGQTSSGLTAAWNQDGMLILNMSQLPSFEACHDFAFTFNVTNSHLARSSSPVVKAKTSCLETPEQDMTYSPGEAAPLADHLGMCSKKIMSQSNPWPGARNTLTFTFSTNVTLVAQVPVIVLCCTCPPVLGTDQHRSDVLNTFACGRVCVRTDTCHLLLPTSSFSSRILYVLLSSCTCTTSSQCSRIVIDNLTEACASDGMMYIGCKDAKRFSMSPRGAQATAMWTTYSSHDHSRQGKLELFLLEDTDPFEEYTICFNVTNPAVSQSAPNIDMLIKQREVSGTGVGLCVHRPMLSLCLPFVKNVPWLPVRLHDSESYT